MESPALRALRNEIAVRRAAILNDRTLTPDQVQQQLRALSDRWMTEAPRAASSDYSTEQPPTQRTAGGSAPPAAPGPDGAPQSPSAPSDDLSRVQASAPDYSSDKAMLQAFDQSEQRGGQGQQGPRRDGFGLSTADWFGMAGGFFSGQTPQDSLGRGMNALSTGIRQRDQHAREDGNRVEERAQRRLQFQQQMQLRRDTLNQNTQDRADNRTIRREQLDIMRNRPTGSGGGASGTNVQRSESLVGPGGEPYFSIMRRDGTPSVVDATGNPVTDPSVLRTLLPRNDTGVGATNRAAGTVTGRTTAERAASAPRDIETADATIRQIDEVLGHDALNSTTGMLSITGFIPGTRMADFANRVRQLQGGVFLEAFKSLKGGGAITEVEGAKAEAAIARLNRNVSPEDFRTAVRELRSIVELGRSRAQGHLRGEGTPSAPAAAPPAFQGRTSAGVGFSFNP